MVEMSAPARFCPSCGKPIGSDARFCPSCGSVIVNGTFTASGGGGNDIEVFVMDQTNYVNWSNGHQANAYYDSGQVTTGTVSAYLPGGGTYYLVYSNAFSSVSSKNVQTTANLYYRS